MFGLWYGKGPGVDRAGDALKHGNAYGASPHGGVLVVAGDDHGCVSSSMPHQSDVAFIAWARLEIGAQSMEPTSQWIVLAHLLRPQGRKGDVLADLRTDFPERFERHPRVWLAAQGFADCAGGDAASVPAEVVSHWLPVGRDAGRIVLRFAGIDGIAQAERLAGKDVLVPIGERLPLDPGAAYISDLIGCMVYDAASSWGRWTPCSLPRRPMALDGWRRQRHCSRSSRRRATRSWCHSPRVSA